MKKILKAVAVMILLTPAGCMTASNEYVARTMAAAITEQANLQAQVVRERIQLERDKAGLRR